MTAGSSAPDRRPVDVTVVGGGNVGICAALSLAERGLRVMLCREAIVRHGHTYTVRSLFKRCANEGMALRLLDVRVRGRQTLRDVLNRKNYRALARGLLRGEVRRPAEVLFPLLRPLGIWYGYHFVRGYWR